MRGFTSKEYKKLQIIKRAREITVQFLENLGILESRFNTKVIKALLEVIRILTKDREMKIKIGSILGNSSFSDLLKFLKSEKASIAEFLNSSANLVEKGEFDKEELLRARKRYFGEVKTESVLFKYCLGVTEVKVILQFLFSVF